MSIPFGLPATLDAHDPAALAARARSVLSCPLSVSLLVDGEEMLLDEGISLRDDDGTPTFFAPVASAVDRAAGEGRHALLRVTAQLDREGMPSEESLVLAGALHLRGECHRGAHQRIITFEVRLVSLVQPGSDDRRESHVHVPTSEFRHPSHRLNRGYLLSCMRHANGSHQDELVRALSRAAGITPDRIAGVSLVDLDPSGVELHWVDDRGAHVLPLRFRRRARSPEELAAMLSTELHADLD